MLSSGPLGPDVLAVQRHYPQIYLACHTRHQRAAHSPSGISGHDSAVLSHLDRRLPVSPAELAAHLGVNASTVSACVDKLEALGYVGRGRSDADRRRVELRLTAAGERALAASSVLEAERVERVLARLTAAERRRAIEGLALLARACREEQREGGPR